MGGNVLWFVLYAVLVVVPFWKLLPRYGVSSYYAGLAIVPAIALILLWYIAFKDDINEGNP